MLPLTTNRMGKEQRQQPGDADYDALIQSQRIDLVLVGVGLPQIELRQVRRAQLGDKGDHRAGIERDAEHVGAGIVLPLRRIARRRRDVDDARLAEIGPNQAGADHAVMRYNDQAVDLLVAAIGECEHRPVLAGFAGAHLDAAHDGVSAGRGRHLDAVAVGLLKLGGVDQIDGGGIGAHGDGLDRVRGGKRGKRGADGDGRGTQSAGAEHHVAQRSQKSISKVGIWRQSRRHDQRFPKGLLVGFVPKSRLLACRAPNRAKTPHPGGFSSRCRGGGQEFSRLFSKGQRDQRLAARRQAAAGGAFAL